MKDFYMLKKGQKFRIFSLKFKEKVLKEYLKRKSKKNYLRPIHSKGNHLFMVVQSICERKHYAEIRDRPAQGTVDYK